MDRILVLGSNGFIGSHLVQNLISSCFVVGYDAPNTESLLQHENYRHIASNFCTEEHFAEILSTYNISAVYHFICTSTPQDGTDHLEDEILSNILPTIRLLNACVSAGVKRVIFASSGGTVYGENTAFTSCTENDRLRPICSYGIQKEMIESYLLLFNHMHNLDISIARIANPYGPGVRLGRTQGIVPILLRNLLADQPAILYGETVRDYLYIDDLTSALVKLLHYEGETNVFNIGSGVGVSLSSLVNQIEHIVGKNFCHVKKINIRKCDVHINILDVSKAKQELQWEAHISLEEGIQKTLLAITS